MVLETVHQMVGVAMGEHLFFCFEALWAGATALHLIRRTDATAASRGAGWTLLAIGVAIGVYALEQLGGPFAALGPLNVLAHGALLFWLIGLALSEALSRPLRRWEIAALVLAWATVILG